MQDYSFTLILGKETSPASDEDTDAWFEAFAESLYGVFETDATPALCGGRAEAGFTLEAASMQRAIRRGLDGMARLGLRVERVEISPDAVPA